MPILEPRAKLLKLVAAHQKGILIDRELEFQAIELIGISNDMSLFDLLPVPMQTKLLKECTEMSDQFIKESFTIIGGTFIIEDMDAYRKEREAQDEAHRNAFRMIRDKARKGPTC